MPSAPILATAPCAEHFTLLRLGLNRPLGPGQGLVLDGGRLLRPLRAGERAMDFLLAAGDALAAADELRFAGQPTAGFPQPDDDGTLLILSDGTGLAPALFAASRLPNGRQALCLHQCGALPQRPCPSRLVVPGLPPEAIASLPWFEQARVAARLAAPDGRPGCYEGSVQALAEHWLQSASAAAIWALGSAALMQAAAAIAGRHGLGADGLGELDASPRPLGVKCRN